MSAAAPLLTVGDIARETRQPLHKVRYALDSYRIEPVQRAGIIRLYSTDDLPRITSALARIAARKGAGHGF
jgi:hypothetical protein